MGSYRAKSWISCNGELHGALAPGCCIKHPQSSCNMLLQSKIVKLLCWAAARRAHGASATGSCTGSEWSSCNMLLQSKGTSFRPNSALISS